jgi:hypothetical protein
MRLTQVTPPANFLTPLPDLDILGRMGFLRIGCVAFILACLPHVAWAAAHRVALLEAADNQVPRGEVAVLRADIEEVVRSLGAEAVSFSETKAVVKGDCREPTCMKALQRATSATHVLRVEMSFRRGAFTIQMQMWDASTGLALSSDGKACDVCTLSGLHAAVRERVGILCARVFQAEPQTPAAAPVQAPPAVSAGTAATPSPQLLAAPPVPAKTAGERTGQVAGVALTVLGVAAAAYGSYLLHLNGKTECRGGEQTNCTHHHTTGGRGVGWLVGGMGALFAGSILFYTFTW